MKNNNIFDGESSRAQFATITYRLLMSRELISNADIMADWLGCTLEDLPANLSNCDRYGELKKAVSEVKKAIRNKLGVNKKDDDCFEEEGNKRNMRFRYVGKDDNPLVEMQVAKTINTLSQYWKFCQDSAGLMPMSWLEYFFKDCHDILAIREKRYSGEQVISASVDRILTNIEYLPSLYEAITNKMVLEIDYKPFDEEEEVTLMFHPHYLKEYNGRWHLFGHAEGKEPKYGYNIALDRIQSKPRERARVEYVPAPKYFYDEFFKDIVGVSHIKDAQKEHIIIRAHKHNIFKLMDTKPLHQSYTVVKPYAQYDDGEYAEFSVDVEPNNEFYGRILQMGAGLEVVSPDSVRNEFAQRVHDMVDLYFKKE